MMASCSDSTLQEEQPEYVDVSLSAYASDIFVNEVRSRGDDDTMPEGCKVRYVIEAWSTGDNPILFYRGVETTDNLSSGLNHSFRIIVGEYDFLFWADYVSNNAGDTTADNHYDTSDGLMSVTIKDDNNNYTASDLSRDCFAGLMAGVAVSSSVDMESIELSRPMAKMVVKNYDASAVVDNKSVSITFSQSIPNGYNVLSGEVITDEDITPTYPNTTKDDNDDVLAFDYIFMTVSTTYDITITVGDISRTSTATPFEPNTITNITSNFF